MHHSKHKITARIKPDLQFRLRDEKIHYISLNTKLNNTKKFTGICNWTVAVIPARGAIVTAAYNKKVNVSTLILVGNITLPSIS